MTNERPSKKFKYYWVQVGVDNNVLFQPVYNFYITKQF
ncbi:hypothetical protein SAMN05421847_1626 [Halpernia humi]|uniref:Uncharacterized protein n=1 Tax=Halpernia humi TaxID=493375 RepID=A0A1H5Y100_9FLAO|nr:hypothetical protein SAMN05421847_1626 [Halpernia humi]